MADGNEKQWFEKDDSAGKKKRPAPSSRPQNRQKKKAPRGGRPNGAPSGRPAGTQGQPRANRVAPNPNAPGKNPQAGKAQRPAGSPSGTPNKGPSGGVKRNTTANRKPTGKKGAQVRGKTPPSAELKDRKKKAQAVKQAPSKKPVKPSKPVKNSKPSEKTSDGHVKLTKGKVDSYTKDRRKRARNRGLKTSIITVGLVFMAVTLLIFVVHHLFNYMAVKPNLEFITSGSVEHTIGARALIVRDEEVVISATEGDLVTQATEGSRVNAGQNIAMVVPSDMEQVVSNLRETQSQISEVQQELIMEG
ncbi:MAG: hypothetical protein IKT14_05200, partial [Clostridiales bacterium]|nr:hypothetical protein [Clostridiales bacterium]